MSKRHVAVGASLLGLVAAGALSFSPGAAQADIAPQAQDVVGVGSDVIQNSVDFLADGSPFGDPGYNSIGNLHRVFDFDASPDANGRAAFQDPSLAAGGLTGTGTTNDGSTSVTTGTGVPLRASVVLAAGQAPQERPNGGGAGVTALTIDTGDNIDFVRSPNPPTAAQQTTANSNLKSYLDTVQFADDAQYIATSAASNAPILSAEALAAIYCKNFTPASGDAYEKAGLAAGTTAPVAKWNQIPGNSGGSSDAIIPLRPQDGAGVLKNFQAAIAPYTSGNACTWSGNVVQVQQNDPTSITSAANPKDAIVVFPLSRFKLLASDYYPDPSTNGWVGNTSGSATDAASASAKRSTSGGFPANTGAGKSTVPLTAAGISLQIPSGKPGAGLAGTTAAPATTATLGDGNHSYYVDLPFYLLLRHSSVTSTTPWQPGSTLNWAQTLIYNVDYVPGGSVPAPYFASAAGQALIKNLGLTPKYQVWKGDSTGLGSAQY